MYHLKELGIILLVRQKKNNRVQLKVIQQTVSQILATYDMNTITKPLLAGFLYGLLFLI